MCPSNVKSSAITITDSKFFFTSILNWLIFFFRVKTRVPLREDNVTFSVRVLPLDLVMKSVISFFRYNAIFDFENHSN